MPIGKDSIRKRVIGSDCATCGECAGKAPSEGKPNTGSSPAPSAATPETAGVGAGKTPARRGRPRKAVSSSSKTPGTAPAVTQSVLTNISPEVAEKIIGPATAEQTGKPTSDHVQITDKMPDYLL